MNSKKEQHKQPLNKDKGWQDVARKRNEMTHEEIAEYQKAMMGVSARITQNEPESAASALKALTKEEEKKQCDFTNAGICLFDLML